MAIAPSTIRPSPFVWSGGCTWLLLMLIKRVVGLRATEEHERIGLDVAEQSLPAYGIMEEPSDTDT